MGPSGRGATAATADRRAIGFRRAMIEAALLLESSFVALTAIAVGSGLGLLLA